ncbi:universal stress protein [Limisphaera sp. VF-2]|jgi:amino acid transporter/nucleotide-binding universal stress UspA family protein|uniref:universal stress protein n=1 Tax=Limisphaera sp. VF-2 TaxID=3400418 RepID=UPI001761E845
MEPAVVHRPRNLDWKRAAALLYGDWGTSKAYVIGLAFLAAGYAALPLIVAVCLLAAVVGYCYTVICREFPDGGGVYSAARLQNRFLAVMGALLLVANMTVTAALSGWAAMTYFGVPQEWVRHTTMLAILIIGFINYFGPKHTGSLAALMALPMVVVVACIILLSLPHLTPRYLEPSHDTFLHNWIAFVGIILALSGVEAIANLTGVMQLDPGATPEQPRVARTARKAILPVALEVVLATVLLGWAMLSLPPELAPQMKERWEDMVRFLGEHYCGLWFGPMAARVFGALVGLVIGLLLLSAVNTAIGALIGLFYMMARDGEMPRAFGRLNPHGVPWWPLALAVALPLATTSVATDLQMLAGLYAIGVVGAIAVNLGSCTFNRGLTLRWYERLIMGLAFFILFAVEITIAKTKPDALFFACCVVGLGLSLRFWAHRRAGLRTVIVSEPVAAAVAPEAMPRFEFKLKPGQNLMVAARGLTPVLRFALEEARLRQANLYVLYVKTIAVAPPGQPSLPDKPRWQDDPVAAPIMTTMLTQAEPLGVRVVPLYAVSDNPAATILDLAATLGVDMLILGARTRRTLVQLFRGDVVNEVSRHLPENIELVIHG